MTSCHKVFGGIMIDLIRAKQNLITLKIIYRDE